ncbi:MAG: SDR family NAD(P)-dependent oxidoreductase, partial [Gammaproteobacteria bacterium]|nr:SDR family NAD(P)-dependent oxidoreductase [Gammaproteobacteria bacterium]
MTKLALVTGASSGIGLATTKLLLENNFAVHAVSRSGTSPDLEHDKLTGIALDLANLEKSDERI